MPDKQRNHEKSGGEEERMITLDLNAMFGLRKSTIFLCHSSTDKEFVRTLASDLSTLWVSPWFDEWELGPGDSLHGSIGKALSESAYLGIVISPDSVDSVWCNSELNSALAREKKESKTVVLPLILRDAKLPVFSRLLVGRDNFKLPVYWVADSSASFSNQYFVPRRCAVYATGPEPTR
jgi:TIR domain